MAKQKLTVSLTDEVLVALQELAAQSGRSVTEELRLAIVDRKYFTEQVRLGHSIHVVERQSTTHNSREYPVRMMS